MKFSVVVPVYGCPAAVKPLCDRLVAALEPLSSDFEIILVNDACPKNSWAEIEKVCAEEKRVVGLNLSRNFGQIRAITAGLEYATGEWTVVMDCDLQDKPENIPLLYAKAQEGYDMVFAKRAGRKDTLLTKFLSRSFYMVYDYFTDGNYDADICNFSIVHRKAVEAYLQSREQHRTYAMLMRWQGFRQTAISLEAEERYEGKSSYNMKRKLKLARDVIFSQSNKPLYFAVECGFIFTALAILAMLALIIRKLCFGGVNEGWTSILVVLLFLGGLQLSAIGVVGIYIGDLFDELKRRPLYNVMEVKNGKSEDKK